MFYKFPIIEHLDQVREAIKGRDEFIIAEREWGFVANYLVNLIDTFKYPNTKDEVRNEHYKIRRECRGIKFDLDGKPIARVYHKFFNINEKPETQDNVIDFSLPFKMLQKLDGSMIHPIPYKGVSVCTKMGITDVAAPVQHFIERGLVSINDGDKTVESIDYIGFMHDMMKNDLTPLFEWCSRKQRIVIDYGEQDHLILTNIRGLYDGNYKTYDEVLNLTAPYGIPVVDQWEGTFDGIQQFMDVVQEREGEEGCVFIFEGGDANGHMLKSKNPWYVQLHKTKELLQFEKDVWALVLDERQDDVVGFMEQEDRDRIESFSRDLYNAITETAERLKWEVIAWVDNNGDSQKKFATDFVNGKNTPFNRHERTMLFKIKLDGDNAYQIVHDYIRGSIGTITKVNDVRCLVGNIEWGSY